MKRGLFVLLFLVAAGCKEEPTIVIRFEPNDLSASPKTVAASVAPDGGAAPPVDLGVVAKKSGPAKKECATAADCVLVPSECCDCANGGKQKAIPKSAEAAAKAERAKKCKTVMCTMMLSTDPTCGKAADCVAGECVMGDRKPPAKK
jgi:hypothetical protein